MIPEEDRDEIPGTTDRLHGPLRNGVQAATVLTGAPQLGQYAALLEISLPQFWQNMVLEYDRS